MRFITFLLLFISYSTFARTTVQQILKNNPTLDPFYAHELAFTIDKYADKYKFPANVFAGILAIESSYKLNAINKRTKDYGLGQISTWNIRVRKLSKKRLLTDMDYSVKWAAVIFSEFYKKHNTDVAVRRYRCGYLKDKKTGIDCIYWKHSIWYLKQVKKNT